MSSSEDDVVEKQPDLAFRENGALSAAEPIRLRDFKTESGHYLTTSQLIERYKELRGPARVQRSHQFRALLFKQIKLQMRQRCTLVCQCCVPLTLILLVGFMQIIFNYLILSQFEKFNNQVFIDDATAPISLKNFYVDFDGLPEIWAMRDPKISADDLGHLFRNGSGSGFLGGIPHSMHTYFPTPAGVTVSTPFVKEPFFKSRSEIQHDLLKLKNKYVVTILGSNRDDVKAAAYSIPFAVMNFIALKLNTTALTSLSIELMAELQTNFPNGADTPGVPPPYTTFDDAMLSMLEALLTVVCDTLDPYVIYPNAQISPNATFNLDMSYGATPFKFAFPNIDLGSFMAALLYPMILSFLLPVMIYTVVLEKEHRLREMMKMMGMRMLNYWVVMMLFYWFMYLAVVLCVVVCSFAFMFALALNGPIAANAVSLILWGFDLTSYALLLASIFQRTRTSTILSYLIVILLPFISFVANAAFFRDKMPPFLWNIFPGLAFYRIVWLVGAACFADLCPSDKEIFLHPANSEIFQQWMFMIGNAIVCYVLAFYLDRVWPREFGVSSKPWFFLEPLFRLARRLYRLCRPSAPSRGSLGLAEDEFLPDSVATSVQTSVPADVESQLEKQPLLPPGQVEDEEGVVVENGKSDPEDVAKERMRVHSARVPGDSPFIVVDLGKSYGAVLGRGGKTAVAELSFAISRGECFGLLGPNGAGKTTTISMLTGLFPPTRGTALVAGFDIRHEISKVHRAMGVCPQFDTLWGDLTCQETLLFYARLKGVAWREETRHVRDSLARVGLDEFRHRLVRKLSGGMRRRLSVAVALMGDPQIVLLDECTTGLDVVAKRQIWDILLEVKKDRSLILTTHSMEEADVLCDRIGIMSKGRLKCVGPQQDLKNRYGRGYSLTVNFPPARKDDAHALVRDILPNAAIEDSFAGQTVFQVPKASVSIGRLFETFEARKAEAGILDWGINQTSLEDVFLRIVREDEAVNWTD